MKKRNGWKWTLGLTIWFGFSTITLLKSQMLDEFYKWPIPAGLTVVFGVLTVFLYSKMEKEQAAAVERFLAEDARRKEAEKRQAAEESAKLREEEAKRQEAERLRIRQMEEARAKAQERQKERAQKEAELSAQLADYLNAIPDAEITVSETPAKKGSVGIVDDIVFSSVTSRSSIESLGNFVVFDVETTGLNTSNSEIIEIAAIRFRDFEPVEKFNTLCMPLRGISEEAEKINGISEEMVEEKPTFQRIAKSLQDFIGEDNLIAHNLEFDLKFIVKYGVDVTEKKRKYYDTLKLAQRVLKKVKTKWDKDVDAYMPDYDSDYDVDNYKLETLANYYGIPLFNGHRALADSYATGRLFESLVKDKLG